MLRSDSKREMMVFLRSVSIFEQNCRLLDVFFIAYGTIGDSVFGRNDGGE